MVSPPITVLLIDGWISEVSTCVEWHQPLLSRCSAGEERVNNHFDVGEEGVKFDAAMGGFHLKYNIISKPLRL